MNAPPTEGREWELFVVAQEKLMAQSEGLPGPWRLEVFDGGFRLLEQYNHPNRPICWTRFPEKDAWGFVNWVPDFRLPFTLVLTAGDRNHRSILIVETEE